MHDLGGAAHVHAHTIQRLRLTKRFAATSAAVKLDDAVFVGESAKLFSWPEQQ